MHHLTDEIIVRGYKKAGLFWLLIVYWLQYILEVDCTWIINWFNKWLFMSECEVFLKWCQENLKMLSRYLFFASLNTFRLEKGNITQRKLHETSIKAKSTVTQVFKEERKLSRTFLWIFKLSFLKKALPISLY